MPFFLYEKKMEEEWGGLNNNQIYTMYLFYVMLKDEIALLLAFYMTLLRPVT